MPKETELEKHAKMMDDFGVAFELEEFMISKGYFVVDGVGRYKKFQEILNELYNINTTELELERRALLNKFKKD